MRFGRLTLLPAVLVLVGCFQGQRTFKVNADGSGTIVDTVKLGEQAMGMRQGMSEMDSSTPAEKAAKKKAKYAEMAAAMGEGVSFVSIVPSKDGGEVATYSFKDITKLRTSMMPTPDESTTTKGEPLTFKLSRNAAGNTVLVVAAAAEKPAAASGTPEAAAAKKKTPAEIQQEIAMMKGLMAGLKIRSVVEVNGRLVKSSSPHASGATVTLMEMDFDQLDAAALQKMAESGTDGPPSAASLKGLKGIKASDPEVTIEFSR
jgi:hypothetical protein